jgi:hypothetical protein
MLNRILVIAALAAGGAVLAKQIQKSRGTAQQSSAKESIDVGAGETH